eukprot:1077276-Pleurochrysis_carterae.AAC.2
MCERGGATFRKGSHRGCVKKGVQRIWRPRVLTVDAAPGTRTPTLRTWPRRRQRGRSRRAAPPPVSTRSAASGQLHAKQPKCSACIA